MTQDYYKFQVGPGNISQDISYSEVDGVRVGVYSAMTQVVTGGPNGSSILTGLTVNILLRQNTVDMGYYTPFDGAVLQKDVVANFIFSSTTEDPYTFYVYNTSAEYQKFLELSSYYLDWGDKTPIVQISGLTPNYVTHTYPKEDAEYVIILRQRNPWGTTKIQKKVSVPYKVVKDVNPKGEAFFIPKGGNWSGTPISYDYIFSGDAENVVSAQTSNNYTTVPFPVSGNTQSRLSELAQYGPKKYMVGVPVIYRNQIWGVIDGIEPNIYTAYTINQVQYYDFPNGVSIYYAESSGLTENNITAVPITKDEILIKVIDQPQILTNVFVERGKNSAYERIQRLGEVDNLGDMINYGYGYYGVKNADKNYL